MTSLVLHSEHFSFQAKYKSASGGLVTSLWAALALPILIPFIFRALQMNSAFCETLSLCIPLPTSVVGIGHCDELGAGSNRTVRAQTLMNVRSFCKNGSPGFHALKQLQYQYDLIHCIPWAVHRCLISPLALA